MDIDAPEGFSHTHEPKTQSVPQTPRHNALQPIPHTRTLHTPTPHRRIGGGLALQGPFPQTPSPTPSPTSSPHPRPLTWRDSASALQEDIAAQFEAEDRLGAPTLKRKRGDVDTGDVSSSAKDGEEGGMGMVQSDVDRLLDDLVSWLAERERKRREI